MKVKQLGSVTFIVRGLLTIIGLCALGLCLGCSKKEDAPPPYYPHVAGYWTGNGTDNAIGYYNWSVNLTQSGSMAAGTYDTSGGYGTTHGDIRIDFGPYGGNNLYALTLTRTGGTICSGYASLAAPTSISNSNVTFSYNVTDCRGTNGGGANLHKVAGTN